MIWQQPWAWIGLLSIALPILIHLLGQGKARRLPFPTLQFFGVTRPLPTQRTRLHDLLLLAVRIAILAAAVAALAQPLLITANRKAAIDNTLVRAVVLDTSASMMRDKPTTNAANQLATQLADSAQTRVILPTANPAGAIAGAVAWLSRQTGRGELVVISDFQLGTIVAHDLTAIPASVGVRLARIPTGAAPAGLEIHTRQNGNDITARFTLSGGVTSVEWTSAGAAPALTPASLLLLAGPTEAGDLAAAIQAAGTLAAPLAPDTSRAIAIVYPLAKERADLQRQIAPLHTAWMVDAVAQLHTDSLQFGEATIAGRNRLVLLPAAAPGTVSSATLIADATRTLTISPQPSELEPEVTADSTLASWQRAPAATGQVTASDRSDGRWFWIAPLVLLAIEWLVRSATVPKPAQEAAHDAAG